MKEDDILRFRLYSRCFPGVPFARHTPRVGGSSSTGAGANVGGGGGANGSVVRVLALLCSRGREDQLATAGRAPSQKRPREENDAEEKDTKEEPGAEGAVDDGPREARQRRRLYVRVQYDKALVETLPIEVMREKHPQILIDYLLSCSVWS